MARRHIQPMGRHRPVRSSWGSIDMEPDNTVVRPACFAVGQADNMDAAYQQALRKQQAAGNLAELDKLLENL